MKKINSMIIASMFIPSVLTACGDNSSSDTESKINNINSESSISDSSSESNINYDSDGESKNEDDEENYNTGDASLDNARNQNRIGENELLVISFGTSFNDSRRLTIGAIEDELEESFPNYSVRRGFTANIVIDHIKRRDGISIDDIEESLKRAVDNGVKNLVVQPTHLMNGIEYDELTSKIANYSDAFEKVAIGEPLLTSEDDFKKVEEAIVDWTSEYDDGKTAICFMGHGTEADSNKVYKELQDMLTADGHKNYFIGTVEAEPSLDDVLSAVKSGSYERVVLEPLMVVSGDHANNDMAGDEEDSWKSVFEKEGFKVECLLRGLGENESIREIYTEHAKKAIDSIS